MFVLIILQIGKNSLKMTVEKCCSFKSSKAFKQRVEFVNLKCGFVFMVVNLKRKIYIAWLCKTFAASIFCSLGL